MPSPAQILAENPHAGRRLKIVGRYGTDINPKPMFSLEYTFHVELNQLDYSSGEDYRYQDDFETIVTPQTGMWIRAVSSNEGI